MVRFVIGHSADAAREAQVAGEEAEHGGFLRLPLTEGYAGLPTKTIMFLRVRARGQAADTAKTAAMTAVAAGTAAPRAVQAQPCHRPS